MAMRFVLLMIALFSTCVPVAQAADLKQQRDYFMQARQALDAGRMQAFTSLKAELAGYPLTPYLDIQQAWKRLDTADTATDNTLIAILHTYADIPETIDLRRAWIGSLAKRGRWPMVAEQFEQHAGLRDALPDIAMMSDWQHGKQEAALLAYSRIWPRQKKPSELIAPLHQAWVQAGHPNDAERWARIIQLAGKGHWQEVAALSSSMTKRQKQWLDYWRKLQGKPQSQFEHWPASLSHPAPMSDTLPRAVITDGIQRLARQDPAKAHATLQQLKHLNITGLHPSLYTSMQKKISLHAARQHLQIAGTWLAELPESSRDTETRAWLTRLYLLKQDWKGVLQVLQQMPPAEQQLDNWQYWKARALDAGGRPMEAAGIYTRLAAGRGYYSFLGAEQAGLPYRFDQETIDIPAAVLQGLQDRPGIQRAREWLALGLNNKAEREWYAALTGSDAQTWKAAAALSASWNWPDQVIRAAYRGGAHNALTARFPLHFEGEVLLAADETGLQPSTIRSIIRQESIFNTQAVSPAGARGLMQLMPGTAKMVGRQMGLRDAHRELFTPLVNIRLGSRYLADMKSRFSDKLALAAAAYNAGPNRVEQWLERTPFESPDIWVEAIPYNETRRYVQHVMAFTIVYQWRENQQPASLNDLLGIHRQGIVPGEQETGNAASDLQLSIAPTDTLP